MTLSQFFGKFKSRYLWGNLAAMAVVVLLLAFGVKFGLDVYTHHGEAISIPNLLHKNINDADEVAKQLKKEAKGVPFLTVFTFGEYGTEDHGENTCGGLMLSFTGFAQNK